MKKENYRVQFLKSEFTNPQAKSKLMFFMIDFNIAYSTEAETIPIEVGIVPFTSVDGPMRLNCFHEIINDSIPQSYILRAKQRSTYEHGITPENNPAVSTTYEVLYDRMNSYIRDTFIKQMKGKTEIYPIVITTNFTQTINIISFIARRAGIYEDIKQSFFSRMIAYEDFIQFYYDYKGLGTPIDVIPQSVFRLLTKDVNEQYYCDFHFHKENRPRHFCCAKVNATYFADILFKYFNVFNDENSFPDDWDK